MLRASANHTARPVDLAAVTDVRVDPLIPHGRDLIAFVDAIMNGDPTLLDQARSALEAAAGRDAMVRAAAVAGNFQMMNRLVDATGVPIGASMRAIAADLGVHPDPPNRTSRRGAP
ncbi:MAG: hypothetical protein AB7R77_24030 [Ilumatobacteraceae bacterium]